MNGTDLREQEKHARDLGWNLGTVWTRGEGRPSGIAILDALTMSGLKLVPDTEGVASAALFTRLPDTASPRVGVGRAA